MPKELSPPEKLAHSTVRLEIMSSDGEISTGTGFFYRLAENGGNHIPVIVTNKHVVEGGIKGKFRLTHQTEDEDPDRNNHLTVEVNSFEKLWIPHPDGVTDLCVIPIGPLLNAALRQNKKFYFAAFSKTQIPTNEELEDLLGLEKIVMVGYPNGIWDEKNNFPVFRQGVTASHPLHDWNGKQEFLIDAACFPGSSGSPVMLFDIGGYTSKKGVFPGPHRIKLLGILYAGPQYTVSGEIKIIPVPTQQKPVVISNIPNNLGIVIKSSKLLDFESTFDKVKAAG